MTTEFIKVEDISDPPPKFRKGTARKVLELLKECGPQKCVAPVVRSIQVQLYVLAKKEGYRLITRAIPKEELETHFGIKDSKKYFRVWLRPARQ
jgi:hypothetical protein